MAGQTFVPHLPFGIDPMIAATAILSITFAAIIWDKLNRAIVALIGAALMILIGALDQAEALNGVDWNTIGLLTGMMILVSISRRSGIFQFLAIWSAQKARANPAGILILLQITTAVVSAFLNNVTTVLLIAPVTLAIARELKVAPYPYLFGEVFASNIGGTATLIGDPPNILIGSLAGLDFNAFIYHLTPAIILVMAVQALIMHLVWGKSLKSTPEHRARVMAMRAGDAVLDPVLLRQSLLVLGLVIAAFVFAGALHAEAATIAMTGAAALMLMDNWRHHNEKQSENVHRTFSDVEWITIFFFIGLFMVVHAVEVSGLLRVLAARLADATGGNLATAGYTILWGSAFLSALVDNIPFVATMIPLVKSMAPAFGGPERIEPLWWSLALGACLGGNATLIGASANLTVAGLAERNGIPFRFTTYACYGVPMTIVSISICHFYVWWRYF
jgi:Na+/H+ antiporter NhaD/arsenite permease-like protein